MYKATIYLYSYEAPCHIEISFHQPSQLEYLVPWLDMSSFDLYVAGGVAAATIGGLYYFKATRNNTPPWAKASIWRTLHEFGNNPVKFLVEQRKERGDVFRVNLLIFSITFVIGAKVSYLTNTSTALCIALILSLIATYSAVEPMAAS